MPALPSRLDAVVFDLDGTLWDATEPVARAWNRIFEEAGVPRRVTVSEVRAVAGMTQETLFARLLPDLHGAQRKRIAHACVEAEDEELERYPSPPYGGVRPLLAELHGQYRLFIVSNCQKGYIERFLRASRLQGLFNGHLCHGDTGLSKTDTLRRLLRRHHVGPAVYVGDTALDQRAAHANGLPFIHAAYGFGRPQLPCVAVQAPWALPAALQRLVRGAHLETVPPLTRRGDPR